MPENKTGLADIPCVGCVYHNGGVCGHPLENEAAFWKLKASQCHTNHFQFEENKQKEKINKEAK